MMKLVVTTVDEKEVIIREIADLESDAIESIIKHAESVAEDREKKFEKSEIKLTR